MNKNRSTCTPANGHSRIITLALSIILVCLLLIPSAITLAAESQRTIRVGWYDTGQNESPENLTGIHAYDYEYLQAIAQYTGWEYEYIHGTWDQCLTWLENGEIDLLSFVQITPQRQQKFGFPKLPMAITNGWLVVNRDSAIKDTSSQALNGINIGIVSGNANNEKMREYGLKYDISLNYIEYDTFSAISGALAGKQIDAAVLSDENLSAEQQCLIHLGSDNQYFATNINDQELLSELDDALLQINNYFPFLANDLHQKYFSTGREGKPIFTAMEQEFINSRPSLPVQFNADWPPVEYYDEELHDYVGISPDIFRLLSEKSGIEFVYTDSDSDNNPASLQWEETPNSLTTISFDYAWAEKHNVYISQPFVTSSIVKLGKNLDAADAHVAINKNAYLTYLLADELKNVTSMHYSKQSERLEAVRTGEADYTYVTQDQANYYRSIPKYKDLKMQQLNNYEQSLCISVQKDSDPALLSIISKSLASITHDELNSIILKNITKTHRNTLSDYLYLFRLPMLVVGTLLLILAVILAKSSTTSRKDAQRLQQAYEQEKAALAIAKKASSAKGSFMSRMSHEIRTPLNAVIGYNTIARNEMTDAKNDQERRQAEMKVMDCLTKSEIASRHLLTIINDVLDMSAIESGKIKISQERFDFKGLITSLTTIFYTQANAKGVELDVILDTLTEEWFMGDQMRTNQILTNLLSNAVKFTPEGGKVRLNICQPEAQQNAAHIRFEVSDSGIGMTREYLEHIWEPFEQADPSISRRFGGTGLGLSITKNLVDLMNGSIRVQSDPGKGTTFTVDLTFARTEQPSSSDIYDFSKVNALVVDDDISTCDYIHLLFNRCGARCTAVTSGLDAIEAYASAKSNNEPYSVCLVDWRMPKMNGLETIRRIRNIAGRNLPIIVISAYDFSEIADQAAEVGVNMFISKPLFQSSLFNLLANICGAPVLSQKPEEHNYDFAGQRVLLAEDNAMNMEIAKRIIGSANLIVDCAWNGQEAVDLFTQNPSGTYQAILMDVRMPVMDGHEATRLIRASQQAEAASIPIIAMTADAFSENIAEALEAGMNEHISKPIDLAKLFETLHKYIK